MYLPSVFSETDPQTLEVFVDEHPLATVVFVAEDRPQVDHIPFMRVAGLGRGERLIAHVSKSNPMWKLIDGGASTVLVFSGASAYVTPSLYPSKAITHQVVPTWNYASVHIRGTLSCSHDLDEKRRTVDRLTRKMESGNASPWSIDDAPTQYIEKMLAGIVALSFEIDSIEGKIKASQNKSREDRKGVIDGLSRHPSSVEAAALAAKKFDQDS